MFFPKFQIVIFINDKFTICKSCFVAKSVFNPCYLTKMLIFLTDKADPD